MERKFTSAESSADTTRRLTKTCEVIECGVDEYRDSDGTITIHLTGREDQFQQWQELNDAGIEVPVLVNEMSSNPKDFELLVAGDSRLVSEQLHLLSRDVDSYSEIFYMIGRTLSDVKQGVGFGLEADSERGMLASFCMHYDQTSEDGVKLMLMPPYRLEKVSYKKMYRQIEQELRSSGYFTEDQIEGLVNSVKIGVEVDEWR